MDIFVHSCFGLWLQLCGFTSPLISLLCECTYSSHVPFTSSATGALAASALWCFSCSGVCSSGNSINILI
ncbi:unnamed protein product, partial [Gongylonema pulchrum]